MKLVVERICLWLALGFVFFLFMVPKYAQAEQIVLKFTWAQNLTPDFSGWRIYSSISSDGSYALFAEIAWDGSTQAEYAATETKEMTEGQHFFVMSALDTSGNESPYSDESSVTLSFPPEAPFNFTIFVVPATP